MAFRNQDTAAAFLSQHFVALMVEYEGPKADGSYTNMDAMVFSGFLIQLHDIPFWVTAGHCLRDIDALITSGDIKVTGGAFLDHFGHLAVYEEGYPFTYEKGLGYYVEDKDNGLDFALIKLNQLQAKAFLNNNLVFISRENWEHQHKLEFESFLMLGIKEGAHTAIKDRKVILNMEQLLLNVDQISHAEIDQSKVPPELTTPPSELWFIGKVAGKDKVDSIRGLSGGPIYGFRYDEQGRLTYHAVALQSHWWTQSRTIFGCPLTLFAEECYQILGGIIEDMTSEEDAET